jgi:hypothetical protein
MTCGVHMSERGRGKMVPVRGMVKWAAGSFLLWAESVPSGPFHIFILFSSFPFLFSYLLHNFFKFDSN